MCQECVKGIIVVGTDGRGVGARIFLLCWLSLGRGQEVTRAVQKRGWKVTVDANPSENLT